MSNRIYKYEIKPKTQTRMPRGARLLHVGVQNGNPMVWAEVDPANAIVGRRLAAFPTGEQPPEGQYIGTVIGVEGWMVLHIYDCGERLRERQERES